MKASFVSSVPGGHRSALVALAIAATLCASAHASTIVFASNLSNETTPSPDPNGRQYQLNFNGGTVAGITNTSTGGTLGYNFVYASAFQSYFNGASSDSGGQPIELDAAVAADASDTQDGGYFLALDSVYQNSAIDISVPTIAGDTYTVTFDWAGVQQRGYSGTTTDFLSVALNGGTSDVTTPVSVSPQGFTGWETGISDTFTAASSGTETLTFLAGGTPTGPNQEPAMTLLDNISVSQNTPSTPSPAPEPNSLILLSSGLLGAAGMIRRRLTA